MGFIKKPRPLKNEMFRINPLRDCIEFVVGTNSGNYSCIT